jgi:hypothetical protein
LEAAVFRCALLAAVCSQFLFGWVIPVFADELEDTPDTVLAPPPAPAEETAAPAPPESPEPTSTPAKDAAPEPQKLNEPISVPVPESPIESLPDPEASDSGITIRIGPEANDDRPKLTDFSDSRFWPAYGRTQWMPGHRDRFGMFSIAGETAVASDEWGGLAFLSGHGFHFLNGPVQTDLRSKVFDFTWGLHWSGEVMEDWSASFTGRVGLFTDFEDSVRDGWRFPAEAIVFHDWTETLEGVGGVKFLDRENLPALPVLGVILRPDDRVRLEAIFPEPRVGIKVYEKDGSENWLTFSGEIGGGEWAIERSNTDLADVVTYNDYSAILGFHHYNVGKGDYALELGYTFARDLEYRSGAGDFESGDTFFIRWSSRD